MLVCGVDEVGRGPLAGPVVAAAVILSEGFPVQELRDSKVLPEKRRRYLAEQIRIVSYWSIGEASPEEIDSINILQATLRAMKRAVEGLTVVPEIVWVDGLFAPEISIPSETLVRGDAQVPSIMAASILAKTYRDDLMIAFSDTYPQYGFHRNKGYPTPEHREALRKYGPCAIHRKSFRLDYVS